MRRYAWQSVWLGALMTLPARARAEPLKLEERIAPACAAAGRQLRPRLEGAVADARARALDVAVTIDALRASYRVKVAVDDATGRGATVLEVATCDEAVDAAVVVIAFAWRETEPSRAVAPPPVATEERSRPRAPAPLPRATTPSTPSFTIASRPERAPALDAASSAVRERATRLSLLTGIDRGTLPRPALLLAGALARSFGNAELVALARYGLPTADEDVDTGVAESQRQDFVSVELRGCHGSGRALRAAVCAGAEAGVVRSRRSLEAEDRAPIDVRLASPRLAGTLTAQVSHRGGLIEPGVELGGAAVAVGQEVGAPWLVVRIAAGAAIAF